MKVENHFVLPVDQYRRQIDMLKYAQEQKALYLSIMTGDDYDTCHQWVRTAEGKGGVVERKEPRVLALTRHTEGNREKETITFDQLLDDVKRRNMIMSPSMTVYYHPKEKKSILAKFININVKGRGKAKKEMFAAQRAGDKVLEAIKDGEQSSYKISNNSLSGAHNSKYTVLWLRSAHSTLTSICRTAAAYANANNEKLLHGNCHYYEPEVVLENIVSVIHQTDFVLLENLVTKYNLYIPTPADVLEDIKRSTQFYWGGEEAFKPIVALLERCTPLQLAAFTYTGNIHTLAKYNDQFFRNFISKLIEIDVSPIDNPDDYFDGISSDMVSFIASLCAHLTKNREFKALKAEDYGVYCQVASTIRKTYAVFDEYQDLIKTLWRTTVTPANIASFTSSTRRAGVVSDTDSTIFTVQNWTEWYTGRLAVDRVSNAVRNTMVYFASQTIIHILAMMSANMGVARDQTHQLAMKNEFAFPVFGLTGRAKHYFALVSEREGLVYEKPKTEIKGADMKNSKAPANIQKAAQEFVEWAMDFIMRGEPIPIVPKLKEIADMERSIIKAIMEGDSTLLTKAEIKPAASYTAANPASSPYGHYLMWEAVFAEKYGPAPNPPYLGLKLSLNADKPGLCKEWIASIEDREIADKLKAWMLANKKTNVGTAYVPMVNAQVHGLPKELVQVMDIRKLVYSTMSTFYLELESFGLYMHNEHLSRLYSDYY